MACTVVQYTRGCHDLWLNNTSIIMKFIVWIINDIHVEFNDIHWEGCLHITRRNHLVTKRNHNWQLEVNNYYFSYDVAQASRPNTLQLGETCMNTRAQGRVKVV